VTCSLGGVPDDPFNTAGLRARVLDAWAASPARFREDANAEEDYALGGYRDRVVVELAQNAADAAARAGVPGTLRLTLAVAGEHGRATLTAANTGAPLDAAGVESLSTLRASSKRGDDAEGTTGRFGVGFAAVAAISDEPRIVTRGGAVEWSRARSAELAAGLPGLAAELAARSGHGPVLRLPFPATAALPQTPLPDGFDTAVILPLRDDAAVTLAGRLLAEAGPALLLALPALAEVTIDTPAGTRVLAARRAGDSVTITITSIPNGRGVPADSPVTATTWRTVAAGGALDPALLADRPVEERARATWSVRWAIPVTSDNQPARLPDGVPPVVHAPTPSDEPLGLPALLLASFPLSPDRRHVAPGPLTAFLVERAADAYARILPPLTAGHGLLDLVPGPVAAGELDVRLRQAILDRLPGVAFLPRPVPDESPRVAPRDALLLDVTAPPGLAGYLAPLWPGLIGGPRRHPAYAALGIRRLPMAELADLLTEVDRPPSWWRGLYAALAGADPAALGELGALPVPLADGRLIRGPRGVLLPGPGLGDPARLAPLRLRIAAAGAAHPLLARLGAMEATPRSVLDHPATLAAVDASMDEDDPAPIAEAVLQLVAAAGVRPGEFPWLADLALPADDGEWDPAGDLLLPGGELAAIVTPEAFGAVEPALAGRYGTGVLEAVGVLTSFGLLTASDVDLGDDLDLDLDGAEDWAAWAGDLLGGTGSSPALDGPVPPSAVEVIAIRDLDLVDPDRWPRALEIIATRPALRAALASPTRIRLADGRHADVPSYTAWWLRTHPVLGGHRPADLRTAAADPLLAGLYDDAASIAGPDPVLARLLADPVLARALGVRDSLAALLAEPGGADELLGRLADPARVVDRAQLRSLWAALAAADPEVTPPERVRVVLGDAVVVASAFDALVLDSPDLWPLVAGRPLVLAPYDRSLVLAELLDIPVASESVPGIVEGTADGAGERRPVPAIVAAVLPDAPESYLAHDKLVVDGGPVPWRCADGEVHAGTAAGLACGLAWAAGQWSARHLLARLLTAPEDAPRLLAEADLDLL
jgi:hypothetical protein